MLKVAVSFVMGVGMGTGGAANAATTPSLPVVKAIKPDPAVALRKSRREYLIFSPHCLGMNLCLSCQNSIYLSSVVTVAALYEGVNELEIEGIPLLASPQGGEAASSRNIAKPPKLTQPGLFSFLFSFGKTPRLRQLRLCTKTA